MRFANVLLALTFCLSPAACDVGAKQAPATAENNGRTVRVTIENDGIRLDPATREYVAIEAVGDGDNQVTIRAPARLAFRDNAVSRVGAPVPARVMKLHVRVGDKVRPGDPLATLASPNASDYHGELARGRVELTASQESLKRQEEMIAKGVGREYEKVVAEMRVRDAEERVRAAKRNVALLGRSSGGTVIVTSQIEGTVLRRSATVGAQVDPDGDPLFEIGNPTDLWVVADVFQDDLTMVHEGATVTVQLANRKEPIEGTVSAVGVLLDTAVRRAPVYIDLKKRDLVDLKAGMFARAFIRAADVQGLTVPVRSVLIKNGSKSIVYVERQDGTFTMRDVILGHVFEDRVEIVSGLESGDKLAVDGALLIDGAANQLL